MIELLSAIGRVVVVIGAVLTVAAFAVGGYLYAYAEEAKIYGIYSISGGGRITPRELVYGVIGAAIGFVVAGAAFGAIATLYIIRDSLRSLLALEIARSRADGARGSPGTGRTRQEPRV
jgi:hypothetical protein